MAAFRKHGKTGSPGTVISFFRTVILLVVMFLSGRPGQLAFVAFGQPHPLQFTHYTVDDGLPSMQVYDLLQDRQGYLWLATEGGLSRFNGYVFENFTTRDGLPVNDITDLKEDTKGRIWLSSFGPLAYYENGVFNELEGEAPAANFLNYDLGETPQGELWVSYDNNLALLDTQLVLQDIRPENLPLNQKNICRLLLAQEDSVWIYYQSALYVLHNRELVRRIPMTYDRNDQMGWRIAVAGPFVYYTADAGLVVIDRRSGAQRLIYPGLSWADRLLILDNDLWFISVSQVARRFEILDDGGLRERDAYLEAEGVTDVLVDRSGNYWFSTYGKGVFFLPAAADKIKVLMTEDGLSSDALESVIFWEDQLVFGAQDGRLNFVDSTGKVEWLDFSRPFSKGINRALAMHRINSGHLLVASDLGLVRVTPDDGEVRLLHRISTKSFYPHPDGRVLVNTFRGAYLTNEEYLARPDLPTLYTYFPYLPEYREIFRERCYSSLIDRSGTIWLGNTKSGLTAICPDSSVVRWAERYPAFHSTAMDIKELPNGLICVATHGEGLLFLKDAVLF